MAGVVSKIWRDIAILYRDGTEIQYIDVVNCFLTLFLTLRMLFRRLGALSN
jgi:hypothetical protein